MERSVHYCLKSATYTHTRALFSSFTFCFGWRVGGAPNKAKPQGPSHRPRPDAWAHNVYLCRDIHRSESNAANAIRWDSSWFDSTLAGDTEQELLQEWLYVNNVLPSLVGKGMRDVLQMYKEVIGLIADGAKKEKMETWTLPFSKFTPHIIQQSANIHRKQGETRAAKAEFDSNLIN